MKTMNIDSDYELQKYLLEQEMEDEKISIYELGDIPNIYFVEELQQENKKLQDKLYKIRETITLRNQEMTKLLYIELLEILEGKNEKR